MPSTSRKPALTLRSLLPRDGNHHVPDLNFFPSEAQKDLRPFPSLTQFGPISGADLALIVLAPLLLPSVTRPSGGNEANGKGERTAIRDGRLWIPEPIGRIYPPSRLRPGAFPPSTDLSRLGFPMSHKENLPLPTN